MLRDRGFRGCTAFDCFGAGQAVSQRLFSGVSWRERPDTRHRMFAAFGVLKQVHEMIWYLAEAQERTYDAGIRQQVRDLTESLESLSRGNVDHLLAADMGSVHASVRTLLVEVSAEVRGSYFADDGGLDPRIGRGADLAGCDLRRTRLCGADLRGAVLIGADLRECDLTAVDLLGADLRDARMAGADLSASLYLTQPQIAAARGDAHTRLPAAVSAPFHW